MSRVVVLFLPPAKKEPRIAMALYDGNVRWMLQAEYTPNGRPLDTLCEMLAAAVPTWESRIHAARLG